MWPFSRKPAAGAAKTPIPGIGVRDVRARLKGGAKLLDVRTEREYQAVHPAGAISLPLSTLKKRPPELPLDTEILVICLKGSRSAHAARILQGYGYTNVTDVQGGMEHWVKFGLPVKRSAAKK